MVQIRSISSVLVLSLPKFNYIISIPSLASSSVGSQSTTVSHVMSAQWDVIEDDIRGVLGQLPFRLHRGEGKQKVLQCRMREETNQIATLISNEADVPSIDLISHGTSGVASQRLIRRFSVLIPF